MGAVIGALLPLALVVAISPTTITVLLVMLLSGSRTIVSVVFAVGYVVGIVVDTVALLLLSGLAGLASTGSATGAAAWLLLVVGAVLTLLGIDQWTKRPKSLEAPEVPRWMAAMEKFTVPKSAVISFVLAALRPKNVLIFAAASLAIGTADLPFTEVVIAIALFTVLSSSTVVGLVVAAAFGQERVRPTLADWKVWLQNNSAAMMSVLLLVIGVVLFGKGLGGLI